MWDWFINFLTDVLAALQGFCGDWGLAVIILTFIVRIIVTPLMTKSAANNARMQALQPKLKEIQERYADDPVRQSEEMRKFYSENSFNPMAGCLPMLLQMPVFFALFTVARNVPADAHFFNILPSLSSSVNEMIASAGFGGAWVYILLDILFGVLTFIPMIMNTASQDDAARRQTMTMGLVMSAMMIWFGWNVPAAVLLYYNTSAIWQVLQQRFVTQRIIAKEKAAMEEKAANEPVVVDVVRRDKKKRPHKKA